MRNLLARFFSDRSRTAENVDPASVQPSLWSALPQKADSAPASVNSTSSTGAIADPVNPAATAPGKNPFAAPVTTPSRKPLFMAGRALPPGSGSFWSRLVARLGWSNRSNARRRLFPTTNQLELVLGRPNPPARNRNLEIGVSARVRRSDASARISKVIYESKPAAAADAARMMEESDRAYARLRGRRLESLRVDEED